MGSRSADCSRFAFGASVNNVGFPLRGGTASFLIRAQRKQQKVKWSLLSPRLRLFSADLCLLLHSFSHGVQWGRAGQGPVCSRLDLE